jgi:outer membrane translocation and assembly module TamA
MNPWGRQLLMAAGCGAVLVSVFGPASASENAATTPLRIPESELLLSFSIDLSNEPDNASTFAARAIRTHWHVPADRAEAGARIGNLRKELDARYAAPSVQGPFSAFSLEARAADTRQYLDASRLFGYREASFRNLWSATPASHLVGAGWGIEGVRLDAPEGVAPFLVEYVERQGRTTTAVPLGVFGIRDRRRLGGPLPDGHYTSAIAEWGTPAGTIEYVRFEASHQSYFLVTGGVSVGINAAFGRVEGLGNDLSPYNKRYLGGGVGSVRGYEAGSLSPLDASGAATGADQRATISAEALWHAATLGGTPVVLSLFADRGGFTRSTQAVVGSAYASAWGVGLTIPVRGGLVRAYFVQPRDDSFRVQRFQFEARAAW